MPIIEPEDQTLKSLKGLHLWHGGLSTCSQRVRIVLAEKGLDWESHVVDLNAGEHAGAAYQAINPRGLVPALVDDGQVVIESIDIINHLDGATGPATLHPESADDRAALDDWLTIADEAQADLKLLSFEFLFQPTHKRAPDDLAAFLAGHRNDGLVAFHQEFNSKQGFPREKVAAAVHRTDAGMQAMDAALGGREWLIGSRPSLAEVAWMPNIHRLSLMDWPFERYRHVPGWKARMEEMPGYKKGLVDWEPSKLLDVFAAYVAERKAAGTDVRSFFD